MINSRSIPILLSVVAVLAAGCQSPASHRRGADRAAAGIIAEKQREALGRNEPFTVEPPSETLRKRLLLEQELPRAGEASLGSGHLATIPHWPKETPPLSAGVEASPPPPAKSPLRLSLVDALQVGARNSRDYQSMKEDVFRTALALDLEREEFRWTLDGTVGVEAGTDGSGGETVSGVSGSAEGSLARTLKGGAAISGQIALDVVKLLTQDLSSAFGLLADATVSIPLLRGAGRHVVTEPLVRAEREMLYALWEFERFKRTFAVEVTGAYFAVLRTWQEREHAEENYRGLISSTERARRLSESGRLPGIQYDQSLQNELRARNRWIVAKENHGRSLDALKNLLGLPVDAAVELDGAELEKLAGSAEEVAPAGEETERGETAPLGVSEESALDRALENRLDLRVAEGRVYDAQRAVTIAADALRAELTLLGAAGLGERRNIGSADAGDSSLAFDRGRASALLTVDLGLERTAERNAYRESFIDLEERVRHFQETEDRVKLEVRNRLRDLLEAREGIVIQTQAVVIAERRVKSTDLFLQAGRAEIRDVLESREALFSARTALTSALISYRLAVLEFQRDLGLLEVDEKGLWREFDPVEMKNERS